MVPLVTAVHAGYFSFCHQVFEATYYRRTSIRQGSSHYAYLCPLLWLAICESFLVFCLCFLPFASEGLFLRLPDLFPLLLLLGAVFGCLLLLMPLSDSFPLPVPFLLD